MCPYLYVSFCLPLFTLSAWLAPYEIPMGKLDCLSFSIRNLTQLSISVSVASLKFSQFHINIPEKDSNWPSLGHMPTTGPVCGQEDGIL